MLELRRYQRMFVMRGAAMLLGGRTEAVAEGLGSSLGGGGVVAGGSRRGAPSGRPAGVAG